MPRTVTARRDPSGIGERSFELGSPNLSLRNSGCGKVTWVVTPWTHFPVRARSRSDPAYGLAGVR